MPAIFAKLSWPFRPARAGNDIGTQAVPTDTATQATLAVPSTTSTHSHSHTTARATALVADQPPFRRCQRVPRGLSGLVPRDRSSDNMVHASPAPPSESIVWMKSFGRKAFKRKPVPSFARRGPPVPFVESEADLAATLRDRRHRESLELVRFGRRAASESSTARSHRIGFGLFRQRPLRRQQSCSTVIVHPDPEDEDLLQAPRRQRIGRLHRLKAICEAKLRAMKCRLPRLLPYSRSSSTSKRPRPAHDLRGSYLKPGSRRSSRFNLARLRDWSRQRRESKCQRKMENIKDTRVNHIDYWSWRRRPNAMSQYGSDDELEDDKLEGYPVSEPSAVVTEDYAPAPDVQVEPPRAEATQIEQPAVESPRAVSSSTRYWEFDPDILLPSGTHQALVARGDLEYRSDGVSGSTASESQPRSISGPNSPDDQITIVDIINNDNNYEVADVIEVPREPLDDRVELRAIPLQVPSAPVNTPRRLRIRLWFQAAREPMSEDSDVDVNEQADDEAESADDISEGEYDDEHEKAIDALYPKSRRRVDSKVVDDTPDAPPDDLDNLADDESKRPRHVRRHREPVAAENVAEDDGETNALPLWFYQDPEIGERIQRWAYRTGDAMRRARGEVTPEKAWRPEPRVSYLSGWALHMTRHEHWETLRYPWSISML